MGTNCPVRQDGTFVACCERKTLGVNPDFSIVGERNSGFKRRQIYSYTDPSISGCVRGSSMAFNEQCRYLVVKLSLSLRVELLGYVWVTYHTPQQGTSEMDGHQFKFCFYHRIGPR